MRRHLAYVFLAVLMVITTVLTACGGEATEDESTVVTGQVTTGAPEVVKSEDTSRTEKPQYGGIATLALASDVTAFDEAFGSHPYVTTLHLTNEEMLQGDWTKGPAGTNEANFIHGGINAMHLKAGCLADSWEMPEKGKMIFHIREGVYWHNKAPTNGREVSVDDVVYTFERMCTEPGAYIKMSYPNLSKTVVFTSDEAARTVTVEVPPEEWANALTLFPDFVSIMPKDALEYWGDMKEWEKSIGTGPFILTDYISNGSATFIRNDNYWMTNPIGPGKGDQLPYIDGIKMLIIADASTRAAAFRTGKIDGTSGEYDDVKEFLENPDIKSMMYTSDYCYCMYMRTDKPESPFSKKEVRQALMLAIDFNMIKDDFYDGKAVILNWPICYTREYEDAYVPMEELPADVQYLYSHDVERAKELLTNAGYPNGFETSIITYNYPTWIDFISLIENMWSEIGVTLKIDAKDLAVYSSRVRAKNYDEMIYYYSSANWQKMLNFAGDSQYNMSYVNDEKANAAQAEALDLIGVDDEQLAKNFADIIPYVLEQCWVVAKPSPYAYVIWWPWVKNWNGELHIGYYNSPSYLKYRWQDLDLKQEMTGR